MDRILVVGIINVEAYWRKTGWTVRGSNPGGTRFSAHVQTGPGAHPASYTVGTGSFLGESWPGHCVDNPPHPAPGLKEEYSYSAAVVQLYLYSPSGPSWPVIG
jgi:hypothetical protein